MVPASLPLPLPLWAAPPPEPCEPSELQGATLLPMLSHGHFVSKLCALFLLQEMNKLLKAIYKGLCVSVLLLVQSLKHSEVEGAGKVLLLQSHLTKELSIHCRAC